MPLNYDELPESKFVGEASRTNDLIRVIQKAVGVDVFFHYTERALGGPCSCRLLFQEKVSGLTSTPTIEPHPTVENI